MVNISYDYFVFSQILINMNTNINMNISINMNIWINISNKTLVNNLMIFENVYFNVYYKNIGLEKIKSYHIINPHFLFLLGQFSYMTGKVITIVSGNQL